MDKESVIKKEGDKWVLYSSDGEKRLGTHDTREEAEAQERAIQMNKHGFMEGYMGKSADSLYKTPDFSKMDTGYKRIFGNSSKPLSEKALKRMTGTTSRDIAGRGFKNLGRVGPKGLLGPLGLTYEIADLGESIGKGWYDLRRKLANTPRVDKAQDEIYNRAFNSGIGAYLPFSASGTSLSDMVLGTDFNKKELDRAEEEYWNNYIKRGRQYGAEVGRLIESGLERGESPHLLFNEVQNTVREAAKNNIPLELPTQVPEGRDMSPIERLRKARKKEMEEGFPDIHIGKSINDYLPFGGAHKKDTDRDRSQTDTSQSSDKSIWDRIQNINWGGLPWGKIAAGGGIGLVSLMLLSSALRR
mgnify:CR=1 FL=1